MFLHYLKITLRTIRKEKFRYIITTLGIAVGIVIFSAALLVVEIMNSNNHEMPNADELYKFEMHSKSGNYSGIYNPSLYNITNNGIKDLNKLSIPEIEKVAIHNSGNELYIYNSDQEDLIYEITRTDVNKDFIELMDLKFIHGGVDDNITIKDPVIITDKYAKLLFGTNRVIGKNITSLDHNNYIDNYTVIGVIKSSNSTLLRHNIDFLRLTNFEDMNDYAKILYGYIKVKKDSDIERINSMLRVYMIDTFSRDDTESDTFVQLVPYAYNQIKQPIIYRLGLLLIGGMILAVSLINFVSLLISSMNARVRQFSLRKIVGAQQWTFVAMIIVEMLPAIIVSVLLSYSLLELFIHISPSNIDFLPPNFLNLILAYPFKIGLWILVCSILLSFLMSKRLQRIVLTQGIRGETFSINKSIIGNILLVIELMLTLIFINTSVFLTARSFNSIPEQFIPFSKSQSKAIFEVPLDKLKLSRESEEITIRIKSIPGVSTVVSGLNLGFRGRGAGVELDNKTYYVKEHFMIENYGEFWDLNDPTYKRELAPHEAIINKEFADVLMVDGRNSFNIRSQEYNVVGVVDEIPLTKSGDLSAVFGTPSGYLYMIFPIIVKCDPQSKDRVQKEIMKIIREYLPATIDYSITRLNDILDEDLKKFKTYAIIMLIASLFSIIITVLGIYTSITYDINRKRKQIAIRKINGASSINIFMFISKAYMLIILVAGALASLLHRFLIVQIFKGPDFINFKYSIIFDIAIFLLMTLIIATIVFRKIHKAMSENPAEVIKSE